MLEQIFLKVMDMSRSASMIIAAVFIVRILLKRFPKFISYMLWSVVLFRLLCPVTLEFEISPVPNLKPVFYEYVSDQDDVPIGGLLGGAAVLQTGDETENMLETENMSGTEQMTSIPLSADNRNVKSAEVSWQELFILFGKYVWISGIGIMFLYCLMSTIKICNKVSVSIPFKKNIYITDQTVSPFVMGIFNPKIYLPEGLGEKEQEYIILHEKFHIRRFDHVVKPVAFAALCIHWFNPLVWIAFILFCKDMEMSCDEAVIKKMGDGIKADYSVSLLALSTHPNILRGVPMGFGEGDTKGRIKNLAAFRKTKKGVSAVLIAGVAILIICLASTRKTAIAETAHPEDDITSISGTNDPESEIASVSGANDPEDEITSMSGTNDPEDGGIAAGNPGMGMPVQLNVSLDITEHYHTSVGNPSNLYYIDENNVLWGSGENGYGQLGQGTQDYEFHGEMVKIAENVIDVDYSQKGFVIFLTEDHKLYGVGNAGCGALQQYEAFDWTRYANDEHFYVSEPLLLMENVKFARCGRSDIACLTEDGAVWIWGTIWSEGNFLSNNAYYIEKPQKVLENAVLVTGGWFNHAALLQDGTVWTWGYNGAGNCGVAGLAVVSEPTMVAEGVVMVWTDLAVDNYPQPDAEDVAKAWTGNLRYNTEYDNIAGFDDIYPKLLDNTVILKADGSYWACGENVGTEEKVVHGAEGDYSVIWTHEFYPCE